jgi:transposase
MTIFPELFDQDLQIVQVNVADEITVTLRTTSPTAICPDCETVSKWVQSRYKRNLHDLPMSGRPVRLILEVRRFFCKKSTCTRKIFAEQLPSLYRPHAQRTKRLQEALCRLGLAMGGQAAEDISSEQGMSGSRDTILRLTRQSSLPNPKVLRVIGLDDWAWKRGHRYGTLICDLEQRQPVALLPDRRVETVSAWLQTHPEIEIVSRDGSSEYASAIKKGAPQAKQVSDRWHLIKNLASCVQALLAQCLAEVRRVEQAGTPPKEEGARPSKVRYQAQTRAGKLAQQAGRAERSERYEFISMLRKQGMTSADIAAEAGYA